MDSRILVLSNGLLSVTIINYFDAQAVPDLASGSSIQLAHVPFGMFLSCFEHFPPSLLCTFPAQAALAPSKREWHLEAKIL